MRQDFDQAIRINPRVAEAYSNRGSAYGMLGQRQRAIDDYDEAIRIDSRFARAYAGRGVSLFYLRRDTEAETDFKKALGLDPVLRKRFEPLITEAKAKRRAHFRRSSKPRFDPPPAIWQDHAMALSSRGETE